MTSDGLGGMFEGDSADMCAGKIPLVLMGGRAEGIACADLVARTPISVNGNLIHIDIVFATLCTKCCSLSIPYCNTSL